MDRDTDRYIHIISEKDEPKGKFSNRLGETIKLNASDKLYCGLKELNVSCQFKADYIAPKSSEHSQRLALAVAVPYYIGDNTFREIVVDTGYYTCESLVTLINSRIRGALGPEFPPDDCKLWFNRTTGKIEYFVNGVGEAKSLYQQQVTEKEKSKKVTLVIFSSVTVCLGLQKPDDTPRNFLIGAESIRFPTVKSEHLLHAISPYPPSIRNFDLIFVYISILKRSCVGKFLVPLAEIFPKSDCVPGHRYLNFRNPSPKYIELSEYLRNIEKIDIHLTSETGETLEFGDGAAETRLTLHILSKSMLRKS